MGKAAQLRFPAPLSPLLEVFLTVIRRGWLSWPWGEELRVRYRQDSGCPEDQSLVAKPDNMDQYQRTPWVPFCHVSSAIFFCWHLTVQLQVHTALNLLLRQPPGCQSPHPPPVLKHRVPGGLCSCILAFKARRAERLSFYPFSLLGERVLCGVIQ